MSYEIFVLKCMYRLRSSSLPSSKTRASISVCYYYYYYYYYGYFCLQVNWGL